MNTKETLNALRDLGYTAIESHSVKNGILKTGITIKALPDGTTLTFCPNIYESAYEKDETIEALVSFINETLINEEYDIKKLLEKDFLKKNIYISAMRAGELKSSNIYKHDDTLNIDYYLRINVPVNDQKGSIVLNTDCMEYIDCTLEELWKYAEENTVNNTKVKPITVVFYEMMGEQKIPEENYDYKNEIMFVVSNENNWYGSGILYSKDFIKDTCLKHGWKTIAVIPSSIHEVIFAVNEREHDKDELTEMVKTVNENDVPSDQILADRAYVFNVEKGFI